MSEPVAERPAMTDYGVPEDLDGVLPWSWARERLERSRNLWVVTASGKGRPHALPVWGVWRGDDEFWFSCAPGSRKAANIAANPQIVVMADDTVEVVSVEGRVEVVTDASVIEPVAQAYAAKYVPEPDKAQERSELAAFMASHAVYKVTPSRAFGVIEREDEFSQRATRWRWETHD